MLRGQKILSSFFNLCEIARKIICENGMDKNVFWWFFDKNFHLWDPRPWKNFIWIPIRLYLDWYFPVKKWQNWSKTFCHQRLNGRILYLGTYSRFPIRCLLKNLESFSGVLMKNYIRNRHKFYIMSKIVHQHVSSFSYNYY